MTNVKIDELLPGDTVYMVLDDERHEPETYFKAVTVNDISYYEIKIEGMWYKKECMLSKLFNKM